MHKDNDTNKPISLIKEEFTTELIQLCNDSKLPLFVIEYILKDIIQEVHILTKQQYEADKQRYDQSISSKDNNEN